MAIYFAKFGWDDITIAFPVNIRQINDINKLAKKIKLNLLIESFETLNFLKDNLKSPVNIWLKIDTGNNRTGINWDDEPFISKMIREIKKTTNMKFIGLLTHAGHTYKAKSKQEIEGIYEDTYLKLKNIQERLFLQGFSSVKLSIGDTPGCSIVKDFRGVDEIRPGNFVFYDVMQLKLGSCQEEDIAIGLFCPIVAKHIERNELIIHGGAIHLSKDFVLQEDNSKCFGLVALPTENGWGKILEQTFVSSISQEHGVIKTTNKQLAKLNVGDLVVILPVHSCLTANVMRYYLSLDGEKISIM